MNKLAMVVAVLVGLAAAALAADQLTPVPILNGSFDQGSDAKGVPTGWQAYAGSATATAAVAPEGKALLIDDGDPNSECGVVQTFALKPGLGYEVSVMVRAY
ncbi:MAG: hypothetical protein WCP21_21050, partial [Armatimonadota bacterium]